MDIEITDATSSNDVNQQPIEVLSANPENIPQELRHASYVTNAIRQDSTEVPKDPRNDNCTVAMEQTVVIASANITAPPASSLEGHSSACCRRTITLNSVGATLIIVGVVSFVVSIIMIFDVMPEDYLSGDGNSRTFPSTYLYKCPGLWSAVFLIVDGGMSLCASKKGTKCLHTANFGLSLVTCILMTIYFLLSVVSVSVELNGALRALYFIHIILSIVALFTCICTASINSKQICKAKQRSTLVGVPRTQQQFVQLSNGQCMVLPQNPHYVPTLYQLEPGLYPPPPPPYTSLTGPPPYSENAQEIPVSSRQEYAVPLH